MIQINYIFLEKVTRKFPEDSRKIASLSLVEEGPNKSIRMANLVLKNSNNMNKLIINFNYRVLLVLMQLMVLQLSIHI
jgi:Carbohydrate phosphorylase